MALKRIAERRGLSDFLKQRRARLHPAEVGLSAGSRRRTPGLRREEVAQLAGVGITWYTWFEQGREIRVSSHFLDRLAGALKLDWTERSHLYALAQQRPPPLSVSTPLGTISPALRRMVDSHHYPVNVMSSRWDIVGWNKAAASLFGDYAALPDGQRNIVRLVFTDPRYREIMIDWEEDAQRILAHFRVDVGRAIGDPWFAGFIVEMKEKSPEFRRWWSRYDLFERSEGIKRIHHPRVGEMHFEHTAFGFDIAPGERLRMAVYTPMPGVSERRARRLFGYNRLG